MATRVSKIDSQTNKEVVNMNLSCSYKEAEERVSQLNKENKKDRYFWTVTGINI